MHSPQTASPKTALGENSKRPLSGPYAAAASPGPCVQLLHAAAAASSRFCGTEAAAAATTAAGSGSCSCSGSHVATTWVSAAASRGSRAYQRHQRESNPTRRGHERFTNTRASHVDSGRLSGCNRCSSNCWRSCNCITAVIDSGPPSTTSTWIASAISSASRVRVHTQSIAGTRSIWQAPTDFRNRQRRIFSRPFTNCSCTQPAFSQHPACISL